MLNVILSFLFLISFIMPTLAEEEFNSEIPQLGDSPQVYSPAQTTNNDVVNRILFEARQGAYLLYSNASTLIVGPGEIACNSNTGATNGQTVVYRRNPSNTNVTTVNLDTGSTFSASTTYYVYASCDAAATTFTIVVSLNSATPLGITNYRQLGNFTTDSSSNIANIADLAVVAKLGSWTYSVPSTSTQATTDLLVMCWGQTSTSSLIKIFTDSSPTPTHTIGLCGAGNTSANPFCEAIAPVRKGDYYYQTTTGSVGSLTCQQIPWGQ